jgi:hypothetical protein
MIEKEAVPVMDLIQTLILIAIFKIKKGYETVIPGITDFRLRIRVNK